MAQWEYTDPRTKQPFVVITGDKVPEKIVRQYAKQNAPPPNTSPLQPVPIVSMPTPFEYSDGTVWQSPKGFTGPGVIANTLSRWMKDAPQGAGITPDLVYKEGNKGLIQTGEVAGSLLPQGKLVSSLGRRMLTQGGINGIGEILAGGSPAQIGGHAALGAGTQLGVEALLRGLSLVPIAKIAKKMLDRDARAAEQAEILTAQNASGMARQQAGKDWVKTMDERNIADLQAPLLAEHAGKVADVKAANTAASRAHEEMLHAGKVAAQDAEQAWIAQEAAKQAQYHVEMARHAEQGAQITMEKAKSMIPWIQELTSDGRGLMEMLVGKGKSLMSKGYDRAVQAAKAKALQEVPTMELPLEDVRALKLKPLPIDPRQTARPFRPTMPTNETGLDVAQVKTGDVIDAVTRMKKGSGGDWDLYHRSLDALDQAGVAVDPAAREAYKYGRGLIESMDKGNLIVQNPKTKTWELLPENFTEFMRKEAASDILRNRGMGTAMDSPLMEAMRGAPAVPTPAPKPIAPVPPLKPQPRPEPAAPDLPQMPERGSPTNPKAQPEPTIVPPPEEPDFGEVTLPGSHYTRARAAGALGALLGGLGGSGHGVGGAGLGGGAGAAAGYGLGVLLPDKLKTSLPIAGFPEMLQAILQGSGAGVRALTEEPSGSQVDLTDAERAAIDAEIAQAVKERRTAGDTSSGLSLEVSPSDRP